MTNRLFGIVTATVLLLSGATTATATDQIAAARQSYLDGRYEEALQTLRPAAQAGDANAQNILGAAYEDGNGVARDPVQALAWYEKSAAQGWAKAQVNLGALLRQGAQGVARDAPRAARLFEAAMAQDYAHAYWERGRMHRLGEAGPVDFAAARAAFEKGLALGNGEAGNALAELYRMGQGVEPDMARARAIYAETAATGYAIALGNLAYMFDQGLGGAPNAPAAHALYIEALQRGDANAAVNLADFVFRTPGYWNSRLMAGAYCLYGRDRARDDQRAHADEICAPIEAALSAAEREEAARIRANW